MGSFQNFATEWDVIVIGGGHAGCEAAVASANLGCMTAMVTMNPDRIGFMSCNPAIGGLAKGQLVKEIDALGGVMGMNTDKTAIQYRRLNSSKGPAVRSSRAQCDKALYALRMQEFLREQRNLRILSCEGTAVLVEGGRVQGIRTQDGSVLKARAVVITSGTFLRGLMHTGEDQSIGGRVGDQAALGLSGSLEALGFRLQRLKTGTPPRLHKDSIDYGKTTPQPGDARPMPFSFYFRGERFPVLPQVNCFITYTNDETHGIIEKNFSRSPMFNGVIKGVGPRYCPSIEDKVRRFRDKSRHQLFLEPEGLNTDEVYVNGISTSLPKDVQESFVRTIPGLESAKFIRYGYAVEYDAIDARQLRTTLESKEIQGLFFAGQVNGTSGYEEAGAQGIIAGINAALRVQERESFTLSRLDGYIGVLIDDLVLKGADEPYRMFTSRAEYRLLLREDNADLRLSEGAAKLGVLGPEKYQVFCRKRDEIERLKSKIAGYFFMPSAEVNGWMESRGMSALKDRVAADVFLRRPEISWGDLCALGLDEEEVAWDVAEQVEIQVKYDGYIRRDLELLDGVRKNESLRIPDGLNYDEVPGLSNEIKGRLKQVRPETVGQASRLFGVTPAAVANLVIFLSMRGHRMPRERLNKQVLVDSPR